MPSIYRLGSGSTKATFTYQTLRQSPGHFEVEKGTSETQELGIEVALPGVMVADKVNIQLSVLVGKNKVAFSSTRQSIPWDKDNNRYVVTQAQLSLIAQELVFKINTALGGFDGNNPIVLASPASLTLESVPGVNLAPQRVTVDGTIAITMKQVFGP